MIHDDDPGEFHFCTMFPLLSAHCLLPVTLRGGKSRCHCGDVREEKAEMEWGGRAGQGPIAQLLPSSYTSHGPQLPLS